MSGELAKALVAAQAEMPAVERDSVNPHFKSRFTSLDHLIAVTRPVLNKHGLALVQMPTNIDGAPGLATTLYHASGESTTDVMPLILSGQDMQKLGAALTFARRYAWAAALGISDEEDDDGNTASAPSDGASKPAATAGGGSKQPAAGANPPSPGPAAGPPSDAELLHFKLLAESYAALRPAWPKDDVLAAVEGKDGDWLAKQHARLEEQLAVAVAEAEKEKATA